ncbi:MAG: methyl-accepting chemotaxis protein [Magnetococcales bacterium]|nr:methyl-accepting chemotaxis protein [Magnetococcales bacterium]
MMHDLFDRAVRHRSVLFARFPMATWMRLASGVSLMIFLAVILLNHLSLGAIQQINRDLYQGFQHKDGWRLVSLEVARAENIRMMVRSSRHAEAVKEMKSLIANLLVQVTAIGNGAAEAIHGDIQAYATAFKQLAEAVAQNGALRLALVKDREEVEVQVYGYENRTLEFVLNEFHLAEIEYLADPNAERLNSLQVILDRLRRDASESASSVGNRLDITPYEQTLAAIVEKNRQVEENTAIMERTALKITEDVSAQMQVMDNKTSEQVIATENKVSRTQWDSMVWTGIGVLSTVLIGLWVGRVFQRQMYKVPAGLDVLASGDLTFQFDVPAGSNNELFQVMDAANRLADSLEGSIRSVIHVTENVHRASAEISAAVEEQSTTAVQQVAAVTEITCTMEELSSSSAQIADNARKVLHMSSQTLSKTNQGVSEMAMVIDRMKKITKANRRSSKAIVELGHKSVEITDIMNMINSIADQTKLLAFNAALEAASAGEAGKRFGVVAVEIRRLADSVMESTGHIAARVEQIRGTIQQLVEGSKQDAQQVEEGMEISTRAARILAEVVEGVGTTTDATQQISLATQQQETANRQILSALQGIEQGIQQSSVSINQTSQGIKAMAHLAQTQQEEVAKFKLSG